MSDITVGPHFDAHLDTGDAYLGAPITHGTLFRRASVLRGLNLVGADVVEVTLACDHAQITAIAASHTAYKIISAMAKETASASHRQVRTRKDINV